MQLLPRYLIGFAAMLVLAAAATTSRAGDASATPRTLYRAALKNGPIVVVIDPGHGGHDPGTRGPRGLDEKTVTLAIAKRVYDRLKATRHIHPVLTRDSDTYVSLPHRVAIAQAHHANLFVSIHENAYPSSPSVDGGSCYVLSQHGATDAKASQLAHFENSADPEVAGVHFSSSNRTLNAVLTDLYQNASINDADDLAQAIITQFGQVGPLYHHAPLRANFAVLRDPMIPSVLCETAFLSNPQQAAAMHGSRFRDQLGDAIYHGIVRYFHRHPPMHLESSHSGGYVVKAGDTLSGVAAAHGVSQDTLMDINHLHSRMLRQGQHLEVPHQGRSVPHATPPGQTPRLERYTVRSGDTLWQIAARHGTSAHRLEAINQMASARLQVGQTLKVPAGS